MGMFCRPARLAAAALVLFNVIGATDARAGQQPPPVHGVTGTVATEETIKDTQKAGRGIFARVARLFGGGGRDSASVDDAGDETFAGLKIGTDVLLQDTPSDATLTAEEVDRLLDERARRLEGVIAEVNRSDRTISIRLADGTRQTLRFSGRPGGADQGIDRAGTGARVVVVVKDAAGEPVVLLFRRVS
jgi:hypothetical protein